MSFISMNGLSFISLKHDAPSGLKTKKPTGVDSELISMSPRFEEMIPSWEQGPQHYYGSDQMSFFSVYRELTRAKAYDLPSNVQRIVEKTNEDALPGETDEVETRFHDLFELDDAPDPARGRAT